jgi:hypothetical protein
MTDSTPPKTAPATTRGSNRNRRKAVSSGGRKNELRRRPVWIAVGLAVVVGALFIVFYVWSSRRTIDSSALDKELRAQGYEMFRPFRDDLTPGTIVRLKTAGQEIVLNAAAIGGLPAPQTGKSPDRSWRVAVKLSGSGEAHVLSDLLGAGLEGIDAAEAVMTLTDVTVQSIPLKPLADTVRAHPDLLSDSAQRDKSIVIIHEILVAGKCKCEFHTKDGSKLNLKIKEKEGSLALAGAFTVSADGELVSNRPMPLGFKAYPLRSKSLDLDPESRRTRLEVDERSEAGGKPLSPDEIKKLREGPSSHTSLGSEYQVFALCIGLGNYPNAELDGAPESAVHMANLFRSIAPPEKEGSPRRVVVHTSVSDGGQFAARTHRTRGELLKWIDQFVEQTRPAIDPSKHAIVIFYYCGHGIAEGNFRTAFLMPEDFAVPPDDSRGTGRFIAVANSLVDTGTVIEKLTALVEHPLLLVDSCRKHDNDDDISVRGAKALGLDPDNMRDILKVFQFAGGNSGPHPVLFGGSDGKVTPVVHTDWSSNGVGPIAARMHVLFEDVRRRGANLDLSGFISEMTKSVRTTGGEEARAFTDLRTDFREKLPSAVLFGNSAGEFARRLKPYVPQATIQTPPPNFHDPFANGSNVSSNQSSPSDGVRISRLVKDSISVKGITDFAYLPQQRRFYAVNFGGELWTWTDADRTANRVKQNLNFPIITRLGNAALLYVADERIIYRSNDKGEFEPQTREVYVGSFGRAVDDGSVLVVQSDATIGTPDDVLRYSVSGKIQSLDRFDATPATTVAEFWDGQLIFADELESTLVVRRPQGGSKVVAKGLDRPGAIAVSDRAAFCLGAGGRLYRLTDLNRVEFADLAPGVFAEKFQRTESNRGFEAFDANMLLIAANDGIYSIDLSQAHWHPAVP